MATIKVAHPDSARPALYPIVARVWAVGFLLTGATFALQPQRVVAQLATLSGWVGLSGTVEAPAGNLWHVLALSLMASISLLAWQSAREPGRAGPFHTLLLAKMVSTFGFTILAVQAGSVWALCAATDAFIALTLWLARAADAQRRI